ncbi:ROK family protein [Gryllotalpicola koreensis]|uniref:ROK family transcriptional regulator n=1 Tax=Gryllotalpicola koreensis TaxID=993086 RepID=A0ABP7ZP76_9MICO
MPALDPSAMRRLNASMTLRVMAEIEGDIRMAQLLDRTGLSRRTIELILAELLEDGWVTESAPEPSNWRGRPARTFRFNPQRWVIAGTRIDTGGVRSVVTDVRGAVVGRDFRPVPDFHDPQSALAEVAQSVEAAISAAGVERDTVKAVGVAVPGVVSEEGILVQLKDEQRWTGVAPAAVLSELLGVPAFADNDAKLAAIGERWLGAARGLDTFVWMLAGERNGAGIVIGGTLHHGFGGSAGEIVHAEAFGLARLMGHPVGLLTSPAPESHRAAVAVVKRAWAGDEEALTQVDEFVVPLTGVLATLAWTIAPPVIVLGGGLEDAGPELLVRLERGIAAVNAPAIELRYSSLGAEAAVIGAVRLALDQVDGELFGSVE